MMNPLNFISHGKTFPPRSRHSRGIKTRVWLKVAVALGLATHGLCANTINGDPADNLVFGTAANPLVGTVDNSPGVLHAGTVWLGRASSTIVFDPVYVFRLPVLQPGEIINSADLSFQVVTGGTLGANVDIWGLDFDASPDLLPADFFWGSDDSARSSLIQKGLFNSGVAAPAGKHTTNAIGSINLVSYLNSQYAAGAADKYVFLRLNQDAFDVTARLVLATADHTTPAYRPLITYTTTTRSGVVKNVKSAPFNAVGDGVTNDLAAFASALATLAPGDTLFVPSGTYHLVLNGNALILPQGATIRGEKGASILKLTSNGGNTYRELFRLGGTHVTVENLNITRDADFPLVMIPIWGSSNPSHFTIRNCEISGNRDIYTTNYCHALAIGHNIVSDILIESITVRTCNFGLFQTNTATGTVDRVMVQDCLFEENYATDLEFNAPNATVRNVTVRNCTFRNNQSTSGSAGWAVLRGGDFSSERVHGSHAA